MFNANSATVYVNLSSDLKMTDQSDPSHHAATRKRIVEDVESLGLLEFDQAADAGRARRLADIMEQLPDHVINQIDKRLTCELETDNSSIENLTESCGISAAEKKLLIALVAGQTVGQHAENVGISINTARTHARRLLEKTGSQNQVDLIRKLIR
ncbi:MAG: LuxR C-terminal-related transcriptional regulator [Litoreibacter sp.]|uniref:helix-turn-helix transcriptional regulator n=1 Tax=Litoreibacter sp. TaxID=1969459 RepID=UPI003297FFC5